jgi:CBS domain-containing protein
VSEQTVQDVMTPEVVFLPADTTVDEAARAMREKDIGDVVITDGPALAGVLTDRDIVVRVVADRRDPCTTPVGEVATRDPAMIQVDAPANEAAKLMRERSVRRLLVCDNDRRLVGIVSIGDLAARLDRSSALGEISGATPNN